MSILKINTPPVVDAFVDYSKESGFSGAPYRTYQLVTAIFGLLRESDWVREVRNAAGITTDFLDGFSFLITTHSIACTLLGGTKKENKVPAGLAGVETVLFYGVESCAFLLTLEALKLISLAKIAKDLGLAGTAFVEYTGESLLTLGQLASKVGPACNSRVEFITPYMIYLFQSNISFLKYVVSEEKISSIASIATTVGASCNTGINYVISCAAVPTAYILNEKNIAYLGGIAKTFGFVAQGCVANMIVPLRVFFIAGMIVDLVINLSEYYSTHPNNSISGKIKNEEQKYKGSGGLDDLIDAERLVLEEVLIQKPDDILARLKKSTLMDVVGGVELGMPGATTLDVVQKVFADNSELMTNLLKADPAISAAILAARNATVIQNPFKQEAEKGVLEQFFSIKKNDIMSMLETDPVLKAKLETEIKVIQEADPVLKAILETDPNFVKVVLVPAFQALLKKEHKKVVALLTEKDTLISVAINGVRADFPEDETFSQIKAKIADLKMEKTERMANVAKNIIGIADQSFKLIMFATVVTNPLLLGTASILTIAAPVSHIVSGLVRSKSMHEWYIERMA